MEARSSGSGTASASRLAAQTVRGRTISRRGYVAELRSATEMQVEMAAWRDLAAHALEPNVFAEPEFLLPALQHLTEARNVVLLTVWQGEPASSRGGILRGVFPLLMPRLPLGEVRLWHPPLAPGGAPLVDRSGADAILETAFAHLARRGSRLGGVLFRGVPTEGAFAEALARVSGRLGRVLTAFEPATVPVLAGKARLPAPRGFGQRTAELATTLQVDRARTPRQVRDAVEEFLVLEANGHQGRGHALIEDTGAASFVRTVTRHLARDGRCRVDLLRVDGEAAAAAIVVESGRRAWLWALAGATATAGSSDLAPRARLLRDLSRTQRTRSSIDRTDCAVTDAGEVGGLWSERAAFADYLVGLRPQRSPASIAVRLGEQVKRRVGALGQQAYARLARASAPALTPPRAAGGE